MVTSECRSIQGDDWRSLDELMKCLIDEQRLEIYDVSADFDKAHRTGEQQVYHAMVVLQDDVFEMNAQALMPNGINMWSGEVWQWDNFREREKGRMIQDAQLIPPQMKTAIKRRYEEDE